MIAIADAQTLGSAPSELADDRLTVEEAAPIAGQSLHAFYRAIRLGHIPPGVFFRIGRNVRISKSKLTQWIDAGGSSAAA